MKLFFLLFALIPVARAEDKPPVFPETCKQDCVSLFGEKLGATNHGIESFSNCKPTCVYAKPEFVNKEYAGIEWQCVEFARRWLMREKGFTFPSVDVAADLWNKVKHLESVATKAVRPLEKHSNGASTLPVEGNLLVYAREYEDTGHVAVILRVDQKKKLLYLGEQNFSNKPWKGDYARAVPYLKRDGAYWVLDPYLLGWMSY
jgi:hypothetical protein